MEKALQYNPKSKHDEPMLSLKEKISYGYGDLAANFVWGMITSYLLFFYTDVFGLTAASAGTLFLVTRIFDAANDPVMGVIVDRTKTKHGKARPYLLYFAIPFGIISVLAFITPDLAYTGKLVYAYITYTLLGMAFTAIVLPYGALMPMMTRNTGERAELNSYRGIGRSIGSILVAACTLPLVNLLGGGNQQVGFPIVMAIYSIIGVFLFWITFKNCHERVQGIKKNTTLKKSIGHMLKNKYWILIFINAFLWFARLGVMNGMLIYYLTYVIEKPGSIPINLALLYIANLVGSILALKILRKYSSRNSSMFMYTLATLLLASLLLIEGQSMVLFGAIFFLANIMIGFGDPATLTMLADTIDYQEWKFGNRSEGLLFSSYSFATKFGIAIGSSFIAYALAWAGYNPVDITEKAVNTIRILTFGLPTLITALQVLTLLFYKLDKYHPRIRKDLNEKLGIN